jgi:branched-chain amino acid aminotransferase
MSGSPPVWLDGALVDEASARIAPNDRGFSLADGVFETLRAHQSRSLWLAEHLQRLRAGAACLGIPVPFDDATIATGLGALLTAAGYERSAVRMTLTRGPVPRRGLCPPGEPLRPTFLTTVAPLPRYGPVRVILARSTRRNEHSPLTRIKSLGYGDQILARREADAQGADDAILLNTADRVVCASAANLFARIDGAWVTPPLADGALPGIARARLLARSSAEERSIEVADLERATALVLTNSLGYASVIEFNGLPISEQPPDLDPASLYSLS